MAQTLFRGPVLQGKFNEAGVTGFNLEDKTAAYGVANADSGKTFTSKSGDVTFTLPALTEGRVFTFVNTGADATNQINFACNGAEVIRYAGADKATLANTKATSKVGDYIKIACLQGGSKWAVVDVQGIFA